MDVVATLELMTVSLSHVEQEERRKELSAYLNHLLVNDFATLLQLLYRVDVPEQKLKTVLKENPQADAGDLLVELLLQRQKEKIATRRASPPADDVAGEEVW